MGQIKQSIFFDKSGLDSDSSEMYVQGGDSPYFLNSVLGEDGNQGIRVNLKGNRQITYQQPLTLSNTYFVLGSFYNSLTRKAYAFIFSQPYLSGGVYLYDNRLLAFCEDTEVIEDVFLDPKNYLGLSPAHLLTDIKMIDSWLFYNPKSSEPRMIDTTMAYNYTNNPAYDDTDPSFSAKLGDKYTYRGGLFIANTAISAGQDPVNSAIKWDRIGDSYQDYSTVSGNEFYQAFLAIKTPPTDRIKTAYGSDPSASFNNVEGKTFRFCHRYQYFDNAYSVFSAHSNITLPIDTELYNGEKPGSGIINNYITLSFSLYSAALVKNIEIYFQELGVAWSDWKRLTIIKRQDQSLLDTVDYSFDFYNNESYPALADGLVDIIQDAVPRLASAEEIINKNVLCYAGCTEGFDNLDKDLIKVTLTPEIKALPTLETAKEGTLVRNNIISGDITQSSFLDTSYPGEGRWVYSTLINVNTWFVAAGVASGDVYMVSINGQTNYELLGAADRDTAAHLASAMAGGIQEIGLSSYVYSSGGTIAVQIDQLDTPCSLDISKIYKTGIGISAYLKSTGFKTAAYHPFCIFYYDKALRRGDAQVTPDMSVYVPSINEHSSPVTSTAYRWVINWAVNHEPPTWARYWRWGRAENRRCSRFVQYIASKVIDGDAVVNNSIEVDITPLQTIRTTTVLGENCFPDSVIPLYDFPKGDRIRFITEKTTPATPGTLLGTVINGVYDFEIIKFDVATNKIYVKNFDISATGANVGVNTLVEIYTPRLDTEVETYYEFGNLLSIALDVDGNLVHGGITQNQLLSASPHPATGTFSQGDVYHIMRTPSKPLCTNAGEQTNGVFHESKSWSDFYKSDDWDRGKLGLESPIGEVKRNIIRFSDVYLQNTSINGITTFGVNNVKELNDTYGDIVSIVEVGNQLKVYQEKKAASVGIGRTEYADANGAITVVGSDQVLGVIRYSNTNYGTVFPESVVKNNRYVYGFDPYNGVVWRDSPNGLFPISGQYEGTKNGKMMSYFKEKAKALLTSGVKHCNVFSCWDEEYKMLYVIFKDIVNKVNNATVVFHEPSDRWITFTEMEYTPAGGFNEMLELDYEIVRGFENGIGYHFDEETRFAVFNIPITTTNVREFLPELGITFTVNDPIVIGTANVDAGNVSISLIPNTPIVYISFVEADRNQLAWTGDQYVDINDLEQSGCNREVIQITCEPSCYITEMPAWITIKDSYGNIKSLNGLVTTGTVLLIYPNAPNGGTQLSQQIKFVNTPFTDSDSILVTQQASASTTAPRVRVFQVGTNVNNFSVTDNNTGNIGSGSTTLYLDYVPHSLNHTPGSAIIVTYSVKRNGVTINTGIFNDTVEVQAIHSITVSQAAASGDLYYVYMDEASGVAATYITDQVNIRLIANTPTVIISGISTSITTALNWASNQSGYANKQTAIITALPFSCTIASIPSWITIAGYVVGSTLNNGSAIEIYPTVGNGGIALDSAITFTNSYGDTGSITVRQSAYVAENPNSVLVIDGQVYGSDTTLTISSVSGYVNAAGNNKIINASFRPMKDGVAYYTEFSLYWKAYRGGSLIGSGIATVTNMANTSVGLVCAYEMSAGQTITLIFSSIYF